MTVGSLFAGIGGFDLGFERAGFEIRWQVELDPFCRAVLAEHWPEVRRYEDVRTVHSYTDCWRFQERAELNGGASQDPAYGDSRRRHTDRLGDIAGCRGCLESVDVICGGFPCQPHSLAGRRLGAADDRDLWPEFARLIRELRPRWVVAENVPGLLSADAGRFFGGVLRDLAESGYDAEWDCLPASAFGAPHRRDRVWLVAYPQDGLRRADGRSIYRSEACDGSALSGGALCTGIRTAWADGSSASSQTVADAGSARLAWTERPPIFGTGWGNEGRATPERDSWAVEPDVGRVAYGVSAQVDRLRGLGNAIVPQIAQWIARRITEAEAVTT